MNCSLALERQTCTGPRFKPSPILKVACTAESVQMTVLQSFVDGSFKDT